MQHKQGIVLVMMALALLLLPLQWLTAALLAIAVHEGSHYLAIRLCGRRLNGFRITLSGLVMEIDSLPPLMEFFCAAAGPAGGLALLLLARIFPRVALCGAFQAVYNLLPIYPLDGGRMLYTLTKVLFPAKIADRICGGIEGICVCVLLILGFYGTFVLQLGLFPLLIAGILTQKAVKGKIACKALNSWVQ